MTGSSSSQFSAVNSVKPYANNVWYHYVFSLNGTTGSIYINGQLLISQPNKNIPRSILRYSNYVGFGHWNNYLNGSLDDLKIFNKSLTQAEVLQVANSYY